METNNSQSLNLLSLEDHEHRSPWDLANMIDGVEMQLPCVGCLVNYKDQHGALRVPHLVARDALQMGVSLKVYTQQELIDGIYTPFGREGGEVEARLKQLTKMLNARYRWASPDPNARTIIAVDLSGKETGDTDYGLDVILQYALLRTGLPKSSAALALDTVLASDEVLVFAITNFEADSDQMRRIWGVDANYYRVSRDTNVPDALKMRVSGGITLIGIRKHQGPQILPRLVAEWL
jgi:hypothetical protein